MNRLLDTEEASAMLGVKKSWIEQRRMRNEGPPFVRIGRLIKYRECDLEAYVERNLVRENA
jgi:predicted DNA-binding transcriptional regulator AlpA